MYCLKCGKELQDGSKFCMYCGHQFGSPENTTPDTNNIPDTEHTPVTPPDTTPPTPKKPAVGAGKSHLLVTCLVVALVAVVAATGVFAGFKSGVIGTNATKVAAAVSNTFDDTNTFVEALMSVASLSDDAYTLSVEAGVENASASVELACKSEKKQLRGSVELLNSSVDVTAQIDSEQVQLLIPSLNNRLLVYNYTNEKSGYICDLLSEDEIAEIDSLCELLASDSTQKERTKELKKIISDNYKELLDFDSATSAEYYVDGDYRTCKAYAATLDAQTIQSFLNDLEEYTNKYYAELTEAYTGYTVEELFDEMADDIEDMPSMTLTVYLYQSKLACLSFESEGDTVEIIFHGGDSRMQNIEILADGETVLELEGSTSDSTETLTLTVEDETLGKLSYDSDSGDFSLTIYADGENVSVSGNMVAKKNKSLSLTLDTLRVMGISVDINANVTVSKGASFDNLSGNEFDVGNATEDDLEDLAEDVEYLLEDFLEDYESLLWQWIWMLA